MTETENGKDDGCACKSSGSSCCRGPGKWIWIALIAAVVGVLIAKNVGNRKEIATGGATPAAAETSGLQTATTAPASQGKSLPRLVDLGAGKCIPCKMMAPILDDLKKTYVEKLDVQFIDVWENPDTGKEYGINVIPTQIFYDAAGKELFRHEGFFGKEDILAKWKEFGVDLSISDKAVGGAKPPAEPLGKSAAWRDALPTPQREGEE